MKMIVTVCADLEYQVDGKNRFDCYKKAAHLYQTDKKAKYSALHIGELIHGCHGESVVDGRADRWTNPEYEKQKQEYLQKTLKRTN